MKLAYATLGHRPPSQQTGGGRRGEDAGAANETDREALGSGRRIERDCRRTSAPFYFVVRPSISPVVTSAGVKVDFAESALAAVCV